KDLKETAAEALVEITRPLRLKREELRKNPGEINRIVSQSSEKARDFAEKTLNDVRELTGLVRL
ncbi:MAG: hypothetical protein H6Q21_1746, partial [Bacteroidetes bacterium]|nr:hypothetical protein [Bacteroidota bacterium]